MGKKFFVTACGIAVVFCVGFLFYGEYSGAFLQDNSAAMSLVDDYVAKLVQSYTEGDMTISFKGIVKQGCDFWYYNEYNAKLIAANRAAGVSPMVSTADYSIEYDAIDYSDRQYIIDATVTESFVYTDDEQADVVTKHRFTIEQNGKEMLIVNDEVTSQNPESETTDTPAAATAR